MRTGLFARVTMLAAALTLPAQAQTTTPFSTDLGKLDIQRTANCYIALSAIHNFTTPGGIPLESSVAGPGKEYFGKLLDAYGARLEELLKASGQNVTAVDAVAGPMAEMRQRAQAKDPMLNAEFAQGQSRACLVQADRELVAFRAEPALESAYTCWAFMQAMKDPDGSLMELDLDLVLSKRGVRYYVVAEAKKQGLAQAQAVLAGPTAEAAKMRLAGCPARFAPALRAAAWAGRNIAVSGQDDTYRAMKQDLMNGGARGDAGLKMLSDQNLWSAENADLLRWAASDAVSDAICGAFEPWRGAGKPGTVTPLDIALEKMKAAGFTVPVSYALIANIRNYYGTAYAIQHTQDCAVLDDAEAKRLGMMLVHVPEPDLPPK
jgi:hypothetical protein